MQTPRTEQVIRTHAIGRIAIQSDAVPCVLRASAVRSIREDAVFARPARKKTPAPKPFASPTETAALAPTRFTPRHVSESRVNMRKALLSNGFGVAQGTTNTRQSSPTRRLYFHQPVAMLRVPRTSAVIPRTARRKNSAPNPIRSATATPGAIRNQGEPTARPQDSRSSTTVNRLWSHSKAHQFHPAIASHAQPALRLRPFPIHHSSFAPLRHPSQPPPPSLSPPLRRSAPPPASLRRSVAS